MLSVSSSDEFLPKPPKKRTPVACYHCRNSKVKCAPNPHDSRCQRCIERNLNCIKGPVGTSPEAQGQGVPARTSFYSDRGPQNATPPIASQSPLYQYDSPTTVTWGSTSLWPNTAFNNSLASGVPREAIFQDSYYSTSYSLESGVVGPLYDRPVNHDSDSSPNPTGGTVRHNLPMPSMIHVPSLLFYGYTWDALEQGTHDQPVAADGIQVDPFETESNIPSTSAY
ncbi:hypothetical protein H2248_006251 [Termitomyces sp. 'cryptogamus']|nr:hypothetical protein H2248_006251 [Termitomyces sp. 'cryptogamus']